MENKDPALARSTSETNNASLSASTMSSSSGGSGAGNDGVAGWVTTEGCKRKCKGSIRMWRRRVYRNYQNYRRSNSSRASTVSSTSTSSGASTSLAESSTDADPAQKAHRRRKRHSRRFVHLPSHTAGSSWHRVMKTPLKLLNPEFRWSHNLIYTSLAASWSKIFLFYFSAVFLFTLVYAAIIFHSDCYQDGHPFGVIFLLTAQQMVTGPSLFDLSDRDSPDQNHGCLVISFATATTSLFFQAFVLSMAVRKFLKPKSAIAFSRKLVYNCRNGQPCLQMRIMNLRGTVISDVKVRATWSFPVVTEEGEQHWQMKDLDFIGSQYLRFPAIFTHTIDSKSPLYNAYFDEQSVKGVVAVEVSGYDHVLDADCHVYWAFTLPEDVALYARFADMVLVNSRQAIENGTYQPVLDMASFNQVMISDTVKKALGALCLDRCPFVPKPSVKPTRTVRKSKDSQAEEASEPKKTDSTDVTTSSARELRQATSSVALITDEPSPPAPVTVTSVSLPERAISSTAAKAGDSAPAPPAEQKTTTMAAPATSAVPVPISTLDSVSPNSSSPLSAGSPASPSTTPLGLDDDDISQV